MPRARPSARVRAGRASPSRAGPYLLRLLDHLPHHLLQVRRALLLPRVREEGHPADATVESLVRPAQVQRGHFGVRALGPVGQREGLTAGPPRHLAAVPGVVVAPPAAPQVLQLPAGEEITELLLPQRLPVRSLAAGHQCLQGSALLLTIVEAGLGLCHLLVDVQLVQKEHLGLRHAADNPSAAPAGSEGRRLQEEGEPGPGPPHLAYPSPPRRVGRPLPLALRPRLSPPPCPSPRPCVAPGDGGTNCGEKTVSVKRRTT